MEINNFTRIYKVEFTREKSRNYFLSEYDAKNFINAMVLFYSENDISISLNEFKISENTFFYFKKEMTIKQFEKLAGKDITKSNSSDEIKYHYLGEIDDPEEMRGIAPDDVVDSCPGKMNWFSKSDGSYLFCDDMRTDDIFYNYPVY